MKNQFSLKDHCDYGDALAKADSLAISIVNRCTKTHRVNKAAMKLRGAINDLQRALEGTMSNAEIAEYGFTYFQPANRERARQANAADNLHQ